MLLLITLISFHSCSLLVLSLVRGGCRGRYNDGEVGIGGGRVRVAQMTHPGADLGMTKTRGRRAWGAGICDPLVQRLILVLIFGLIQTEVQMVLEELVHAPRYRGRRRL